MHVINMASAANDWDSLRDEARQLGVTIDSKLHALNKYGVAGPPLKKNNEHFTRTKRAAFAQDVKEVEGLLSQLEDANRRMEAYVYRKDGGSSHTHVLRRFHDVLKDYTFEFRRVRETVEKQMERDDLLSGSFPVAEDSLLNNRSRSNELLLSEQDRIASSDRLLDEQISIAMAVKENINHQQRRLGSIMHQLQITLKKYPAVNNVIQKIRTKKRKDTVILAAVISGCFILLFLYANS